MVLVGGMTHIRGKERRQLKVIRRMILSSSFRDRVRCETACRSSQADVPALLAGFVNAGALPGVEFGEVLMGPRGEGNFRK